MKEKARASAPIVNCAVMPQKRFPQERIPERVLLLGELLQVVRFLFPSEKYKCREDKNG